MYIVALTDSVAEHPTFQKQRNNDKNIMLISFIPIYGRDILYLVLGEAYTEYKLIMRIYEIWCISREEKYFM